MSDISYTWDEYIDLNEKLVAMVAKSGWQFDSILCLSRGGMRPGDFFSRVYDMPLAVLATSSYREAKGTVQSDLDISDCITGVSELKGRVLLVDDMVDSGKTIREVIEHLKKRYPGITEIRVAVLWYKAHSVLVPDWHVEYLEDNPWIHQPFECYDALGPAKLIELVEEEVRDLLDENGFDRDCPVIHTSAYGALHDDAPDHEKWVQSVKDLMDAVDDYIPTPVHDLDKPFLMPIEDVFTISGRGTVVTGRVERGQLAVNTPVEIVGIRPTQQTTVTSIETFHKTMDACEAGDNTGLLLRGLGRDDVERGQVVAKPGSVTPHTKFEGEVYVLTKDEGGRHSPFFSNYRPQFYFRTTDVTGVIELPEGVEMVQPGDHATFTVELIQPIAMEEGLTFAVREGGHTVGSGRVTKILA